MCEPLVLAIMMSMMCHFGAVGVSNGRVDVAAWTGGNTMPLGVAAVHGGILSRMVTVGCDSQLVKADVGQ